MQYSRLTNVSLKFTARHNGGRKQPRIALHYLIQEGNTQSRIVHIMKPKEAKALLYLHQLEYLLLLLYLPWAPPSEVSPEIWAEVRRYINLIDYGELS